MKEAAGHLGLAPTTLAKWRSLGKGPQYRKFGGAIRYSEVDLAAFVGDGILTQGGDQ